METPTPVVATPEPSMADLRAMRTALDSPEVAKPEPVEPKAAEPEAVKEPAEKQQEPIEKDEPLPEGVQKRIAKEAEKAARIQSEIDRAVSTRKAKEKELADLSASGTAPVKNAATAEKKAPEFGKDTGHESETYAQFEVRKEAYLEAKIEARMEAKFEQKQREAAGNARRDAGIKGAIEAGHVKDAAEFTALMTTAEGIAPDQLQTAIAALDDWAGVAVHLAKDPAKLKDLATMFEANPYAAIAKLGRIEASLKSVSKPAAAEKVLPEPPAKEGGGASASVGAFDIDKSSMRQLRNHVVKLGLRKAG